MIMTDLGGHLQDPCDIRAARDALVDASRSDAVGNLAGPDRACLLLVRCAQVLLLPRVNFHQLHGSSTGCD